MACILIAARHNEHVLYDTRVTDSVQKCLSNHPGICMKPRKEQRQPRHEWNTQFQSYSKLFYLFFYNYDSCIMHEGNEDLNLEYR